ncbi:sensor histidine kinase [Paenibacillus sp. SYP-B3998]|uniref:Sensor histidine kinase n=1 Tax=Paenibacillus sp. SYP-B3998 TaxID=2678564 RepID=A0A6G4A495_9BACL|nr:sensor histidine kinase [Paenibacillus sp. SYP-B3998]NEW09108.1 sensor histidine kinase [Paenibacillus sp. SYP-B3998]
MPRIGTFYQNHLKRKMFNKILFLYSIALIILFVTVSFLVYRYYEQRVIQEKMDKNLQTIDIVSVYMNQQVERMQSNIQELYTDAVVNEDLNYFLTHEYTTYLEHRLNRYFNSENYQGKGIDTYLKSIVESEIGIENLILYSYEKRFFYILNQSYQDRITSPISDLEETKWLKELKNQSWRSLEDGALLERKLEGKSLFMYARTLQDPVSLKTNGLMIFDFNTDQIIKSIPGMTEDKRGKFVIVTPSGEVIYDSGNEYYGKTYPYWRELQTPKEWYALEEPSKVNLINIGNTGLVIAGIIPISTIQESVHTVRNTLIGVTLLCIVVSFAFTFTVIRRFSKKIRKIMLHTSRLQGGDLSARIRMEGEDELQQISESFNYMCDRLESYIENMYVSEIRQKSAELSALQAQINPHFLYNTLESIRMKALASGNRDVGQMIYLLADIFRNMIRNKTNISLSEEIAMCASYLELFQFRYEDTLIVHTQINSSIANCKVLKLLIQPIVENYVVHGFRPNATDNRISITAHIVNERIVVKVMDNGKGITKETLAGIEKRLRQNHSMESLPSNSLGLFNVNERIRLTYGNEYGIRIWSEVNEGTEVSLEIPAWKEEPLA